MDREEFARFDEGLEQPMYVVTTMAAGERSGCLLGFGTRVSVDPPRYLVCLSMKNHTHDVAVGAQLVAVHLLGADQHDLAELFGGETGDDVDKFEKCSWRAGPGGVPLLDDCPRVMVGRVLERHPWGDHTALLLDPFALEVRGGEPGLDQTDVLDIDPGHDA